MELAEIAFTDEDLATLSRALDLLKEKNEFTDSFLEKFGALDSGFRFDPLNILRDTAKAQKKINREKQEERIITLQYKLLQFKKYLKQPESPADRDIRTRTSGE
jgi:hypothetical protein